MRIHRGTKCRLDLDYLRKLAVIIQNNNIDFHHRSACRGGCVTSVAERRARAAGLGAFIHHPALTDTLHLFQPSHSLVTEQVQFFVNLSPLGTCPPATHK